MNKIDLLKINSQVSVIREQSLVKKKFCFQKETSLNRFINNTYKSLLYNILYIYF